MQPCLSQSLAKWHPADKGGPGQVPSATQRAMGTICQQEAQELQPAGTELPISTASGMLHALPHHLPTELEELLNNTSAA